MDQGNFVVHLSNTILVDVDFRVLVSLVDHVFCILHDLPLHLYFYLYLY